MRVPPLLSYTVLRLAVFLVPFGIMMLFPIMREYYWLSAIFAALIGVALSSLWLRPLLSALSAQIEQRRARRAADVSDESSEDAALDGP